MTHYDEEHAFQQQLLARMQQQASEEEDEAERAWQAALAASGGSSFGSHLLDPKSKGGNAMPPSLANVFQPPDTTGMSQEEADEEAERAWREALALQGADGDEPMVDEDAERAWQEALEAQQEALDLQDDAYYEELYRNTRINEANKVSLEKEIIDLNEQRWKLRDKKAEYYSGMKDLMESSKALDVLRHSTTSGAQTQLKGILKKRLERVKIDRRLTLRMTRSPLHNSPKKKRVGFILPDEVSPAEQEKMLQKKNQELEKLMQNSSGDNEEEFLEMSLQFIQDFKEEEERLKAESEEIKRMEEQVAKLEAELAKEGFALAQKYTGDSAPANPSTVKLKPTEDPLADAKDATLPARIKRGTKGFGGVFIDEVHKMLGAEELEKINAKIASAAQEDEDDDDDEDEDGDKLMDQAADASLPARIKRGTKGFGGVFIDQVHKMLEEEQAAEAAAAAAAANGGKPAGNGAATSPAKGPASPVPPPRGGQPPKPAPGAKPAPGTKPAPAAGGPAKPPPSVSKLQLDRLNKEEEDRKAAEAKAKKDEEEKRNKERLHKAAEARKTLASPRTPTGPPPATNGGPPSTSPRTTNPPPQQPAKPAPTTASPRPTPPTTPTGNGTASPSPRPGPPSTASPRPTPSPPGGGPGLRGTPVPTQPSPTTNDPKKPFTAPAPTPRYTPGQPATNGASRPDRSNSDPPTAAAGRGNPPPSSTALRLEAQQGGGLQPPSPGRGAAPSSPPGRPGATPRPATVQLAKGSSSSERISRPVSMGGPSTYTKPAPAGGRGGPVGKPAPPVKPLNHPEPLKRGVGRPTNLDPTISAKTNIFEAKSQEPEQPEEDPEKILQRRARLENFKNKILAKSPRSN